MEDLEECEERSIACGACRPRVYRRDSYRAWFVCMCTVICNILMFGCTKTFGVIYPVLLDEFHEGKAKTAWVGSLAMSLCLFLSPLSAKLIKRFGARLVTIAGGVIASAGFFSTSFVDNLTVMYCTYSIVFGLGVSFSFTANLDVIPKYFKKRIGIAIGIMQAGNGAAYFVMSPIIETLLTHVGWRHTYKALAGMVLLVCICGLFYSPNVEKDDELPAQRVMIVQARRAPRSLLRNGRLITCCVFGFFFPLGNTMPIVHMGRYAQESGYNLSDIANLYVGFGIATMTGRIMSGRICDLKSVNPYYLLSSVALVLGISIFLIPFAKDFVGFMLYFCTHGFLDGFYATLMTVLVIRNTDAKQRTQGFGIQLLFSSFGFGLGPPLAGFIADEVGSYIPAFYTSGAIVLFSAGVIMAHKCFRPQNETTTRTELVLLPEGDAIVTERLTVL